MAIALVETLTFGLGHLAEAARSRGHALYLLTADRSLYQHELAPGTAGEVNVVEVDTSDVEKVVTVLRDIPGLAGVVRMTDRWSLPALAAAELLGLPHENREAVTLLQDKSRLRKHLYEHGFSRSSSVTFDPHTSTLPELSQKLSFPAIVKEISGSSSQNVWLARSPADLPEVVAAARAAGKMRGGALTAEAYFMGPMYSAETLTWNGETRVLGVTSRVLSPEPHFREEAGSFPVAFPEDMGKELAGWVSDILSSAGYRVGFTHTEFIVTADGFEIVEINSRMGGALIGDSMNRSLGVNVHSAFLDLALGRRPELFDVPLEPRGGAAQICIYAPQIGIFEGIDGVQSLAGQPGEPRLLLVRRPGDTIPVTTDQRGALGFVTAQGPTSELALYNVLSAAGKLIPRVAPER